MSLVRWARVRRTCASTPAGPSGRNAAGSALASSAFGKIKGLKGFTLCAERATNFCPFFLFCSVLTRHRILNRPPSPQPQTPPTTVPFVRLVLPSSLLLSLSFHSRSRIPQFVHDPLTDELRASRPYTQARSSVARGELDTAARLPSATRRNLLCSDRFLGDARANAGVRAGASLPDGPAYAQGEDGCRARSASTSECAGMDLSGHQSSAHREAVHGDVDARFLHSSGTQEGAHVVGSFVSAACVLLWRDALGHALSIRLEHVSLSIPFAPAHHPTGSFCLHRSIPSIYLGSASRPQ
ncbi:hypothetical protein B0H13DRAFT_2682431 [Mycena leptocephala]|nr:hypothetical protein B0H13DRAFT_2682431 [Mycena leptocephala]